jgi:hypothetical protein
MSSSYDGSNGSDGGSDPEFEDATRADDILDEWESLGWFRWLPNSAAVALDLLDEDGNVARSLLVTSFAELEADRLGHDLWLAPLPPSEADLADADDDVDLYSEVEEFRAQLIGNRDRWHKALDRIGHPPIDDLDQLLDAMVDFGLLEEINGILSLSDDVPDPLEVLDADEDETQDEQGHRFVETAELVDEALFGLFVNPPRDSFKTSLDRLADECEADVDVLRLVLGVLLDEADTGFSADRFGPLTGDLLNGLAAHQTFTLRLDPAVRDEVVGLAEGMAAELPDD